jgi:hypothetical protein
LLDDKVFARMKRGTYVINTSRGKLVEPKLTWSEMLGVMEASRVDQLQRNSGDRRLLADLIALYMTALNRSARS